MWGASKANFFVVDDLSANHRRRGICVAIQSREHAQGAVPGRSARALAVSVARTRWDLQPSDIAREVPPTRHVDITSSCVASWGVSD